MSAYSTHFQDPAAAERYEQLYRSGTADDVIWSLEQEFLASILRQNEDRWPKCSYLDFACGTGRVISFMEAKVGYARGIDIAADMLKVAKEKLHQAELICADITGSAPIEARYDLITAFRFFLNAERGLRVEVMRALRARLKNQHSLLVFTNHGNPFSYKAVFWPYHRLRHAMGASHTAGNYLTHGQVKGLLRASGLQMVMRVGLGFVSPKLLRLRPQLCARIERVCAGRRLLGRFGVTQIYVAKAS